MSMATDEWLIALFENSGTPISTTPVWSVGDGSVMMPYWFVVAVSSVFSVLPWIRRFSLGTLLIVTTLFAMMLGLAVYAARN
jgi:hypothetical protein